jgi:hypothetical protein
VNRRDDGCSSLRGAAPPRAGRSAQAAEFVMSAPAMKVRPAASTTALTADRRRRRRRRTDLRTACDRVDRRLSTVRRRRRPCSSARLIYGSRPRLLIPGGIASGVQLVPELTPPLRCRAASWTEAADGDNAGKSASSGSCAGSEHQRPSIAMVLASAGAALRPSPIRACAGGAALQRMPRARSEKRTKARRTGCSRSACMAAVSALRSCARERGRETPARRGSSPGRGVQAS